MIINNIVFDKDSLLPPFNKGWVLENATLTGTSITIAPKGGRARIYLTTPVRTDFKNYRVVTEFQSTIADELWNYRSVPSIQIEEAYLDADGKVDAVNFRSLAFNITNPKSSIHKDTTILETYNRPMRYMRFIILNNSDAPLVIKSVSLNTSVDISEKQVSKIYNQATSNASATQMVNYVNEQGAIMGLGFVVGAGDKITDSDTEMKFGFEYYQGRLIRINTNYGQKVSVFNVKGKPNLENSNPSPNIVTKPPKSIE